MIEISNRDYDLIVEKLPMLLAAAPRTDNNRFNEARRMLDQLYKKLIRKRNKNK